MIDQKQTQCKQIVDYIRANGHITSLEAAKHLNITQLCARIVDLEVVDLFSTSLNSRSATVKIRLPITQSPDQESNHE